MFRKTALLVADDILCRLVKMTIAHDISIDNQEELANILANVLDDHLRLGLYEKYNQDTQNYIREQFARHLHTLIPLYVTSYYISVTDENGRYKQFHEGPGVQYNSRRQGWLTTVESLVLPESLFGNQAELYRQLQNVIQATNDLMQLPQQIWKMSGNHLSFYKTVPKEVLKIALDYYTNQNSDALLADHDQNRWRCTLL